MKVNVYSTKGRKVTPVESKATTWGQLKEDLIAAGLDPSGKKAIIAENQVTLESSGAVLPKGLTVGGQITDDFTLFLTPIKVKSGGDVVDVESMDYKACKAFIKGVYQENKDLFKDYTRKGTPALKAMIKGFIASQTEEVEATNEFDPIAVIDGTIEKLAELKSYLANLPEETPEVDAQVQLVDELSAKWAEVEKNLKG